MANLWILFAFREIQTQYFPFCSETTTLLLHTIGKARLNSSPTFYPILSHELLLYMPFQITSTISYQLHPFLNTFVILSANPPIIVEIHLSKSEIPSMIYAFLPFLLRKYARYSIRQAPAHYDRTNIHFNDSIRKYHVSFRLPPSSVRSSQADAPTQDDCGIYFSLSLLYMMRISLLTFWVWALLFHSISPHILPALRLDNQ